MEAGEGNMYELTPTPAPQSAFIQVNLVTTPASAACVHPPSLGFGSTPPLLVVVTPVVVYHSFITVRFREV